MDTLSGFLTFFFALFIAMVQYWYVSLPILALVIWGYIKTTNPDLKRALRIFLALIGLSVLAMGVMLIVG